MSKRKERDQLSQHTNPPTPSADFTQDTEPEQSEHLETVKRTIGRWMEHGPANKGILLDVGELQELQESEDVEAFLLTFCSVIGDRSRKHRKSRLRGREEYLDNFRAMYHFFTCFAYKWAQSELKSDNKVQEFNRVLEAMKGDGGYWSGFINAEKSHQKAAYVAGFLIDKLYSEVFDEIGDKRPKEYEGREHKGIVNFIRMNCYRYSDAQESAKEALNGDSKNFFLDIFLKKI